MLLQKFVVVLFVITLFWKIIRYMCSMLNVEKEPVRVLVTGAAGKPCFVHFNVLYHLIFG